uniref:Mitochondrial chaperone BCS1 n=1 Tax=Palpitomonas bilix TaxID=652834 RepID=A0A7S3DDN4_9EUKA|mmetsp:Transcript_33474/g.85594  ORF Transcript_33474/g.85594 Transcript_33474/m.85594 type:complete len:517 (+) Transcript_33474:357-1907(+)
MPGDDGILGLSGMLGRLVGLKLGELSDSSTATVMAASALYSLVSYYYDDIYDYFLRAVTVEITVDSRDDTYWWIAGWLAANESIKKNSTRFALVSQVTKRTYSSSEDEERSNNYYFLPDTGTHRIQYKGRYVWVTKKGADKKSRTRDAIDSYSLMVAGRKKDILVELIEEGKKVQDMMEKERTVIYSPDRYGDWEKLSSKRRRKLDTIFIKDEVVGKVVDDVENFLDSEEWYAQHGVPYRRGYLLYGPPGTGKTSLVTAIAGHLGLRIYTINVASSTLTDEGLFALLGSAPTKCILLLEDIDAAFVGRKKGSGSKSKVTFSALLNALDGVAAQEGRLVFMTTNHKERLSSALIRPGRIDRSELISYAGRKEVESMFTHFYGEKSHLAEVFWTKLIKTAKDEHGADMGKDDLPLAAARLQSFFLLHRGDADGAVRDVGDLVVSVMSTLRRGDSADFPSLALEEEEGKKKKKKSRRGSNQTGSGEEEEEEDLSSDTDESDNDEDEKKTGSADETDEDA